MSEKLIQNLNYSYRCCKCDSILSLELIYENNEPIINYICTQKHFGKELISKFFELIIKNQKLNHNICNNCKQKNNKENLYKCVTCNKLYCNECYKVIISKQIHKLIKLSKYDITCPFHTNNYIKYCFQCNQNLCINCLNYHNNHNICDLSENIFQNKFEKLRKNISLYENKITEIIKIRDEIINYFTNFIEINNKILQFYKDMILIYDKNSNKKKINYFYLNNLENIKYNILRNQINCNELFKKSNEFNIFLSQFSYSTFVQVRILKAHYKPINHIKILNDGRLIASFSDGSLNVYNKDNRNLECMLKVHNENVLYFTQLIDNRIITCSTDTTMKIFKILDHDFHVDQVLNGHKEQVEKVLQYNENLLISISIDKTMKIWEKKNNEINYLCSKTIEYENKQKNANAIIINKNEFATLSYETIKFWNLNFENFKTINNINGSVFNQSMEMINNDILCIGCRDFFGFCFIKISTHQIMLRIKGPRIIFSLIKCKNDSFVASMIDENNKISIVKFKYNNVDLVKIYENNQNHDKLILNLTELNNGEIAAGSNDGIIKFYI